MHAFQAPELGPLGHADPDAIALYRAPLRRHYPATEFDCRSLGAADDALPRVDIVCSYAGCDGAAVDACVAAGARGLVVAALAPGLTPLAQGAAIRAAQASGVVVVYGTRAAGGRVVPMSSSMPPGVVTADSLSPQKARILLMLALATWGSTDMAVIQQAFDTY